MKKSSENKKTTLHPFKYFTWFQWTLLGFWALLNFIKSSIGGAGVPGSLGQATGASFVVIIFMWLYNKFIRPKINVTNKYLIKIWGYIRIAVTGLIILWIFLFVYGRS